MFPILFKIGNFPIHTFGLMLVIGVSLAVWWAGKRAPSRGIEATAVYDATFWIVIAGVLGARIFFIAQEWGYYSKHTSELFAWQFSGPTSFGGLVFGFFAALFFCRARKISFPAFGDTLGGPFLVAHAVGRIGCFMNGCCYGGPTHSWIGCQFPDSPAKHVPAQLFDTALTLFATWILVRWERGDRAPGQSVGLTIVLYGLGRFIYEFFRAGSSSTYWGSLPITEAQAFSILVVILGGILFARAKKRTESGFPGEGLGDAGARL